jgi:hypothetical protein
MGDVHTGRLVIPHVGVQRAPAEHLAGDHRGRRDVALERLVIGVQPRRGDEQRQRAEHDDDDGGLSGRRFHLRRSTPELARFGSK